MFVLVSTAAGHQPGAVTVTVDGEPLDADVLLVRSSSVAGRVRGDAGSVVGARVVLVQDGEIVDETDSGLAGEFRFGELSAGEYGLSVAADDHAPAALLLHVSEATDLLQDVTLDPAEELATDRR